ncbi:MAG: TonB-dependent receptor [Pseudomonadales bacterium]|nr:TonB-dependent receptor [Pseudomonadales bacterium]
MKKINSVKRPGQIFKKAALALAIASASSTVFADGKIEGSLLTANKQVALEGAMVRINELGLETSTDRSGGFKFPRVKAGTYTLTIEYIGAKKETRTVIVEDDEVAVIDIKFGEETPELEHVIVVGQAASLNQSLNKQRSADNIISVVDADAMGQFPDTNLAESLQRVPGISLERDQGEGRFIRVRGLGKDFNAVSINGTKIPAPESDTRAVALDVVPNDLVESITVTKSLTPDMDADSLGGSINVESLSAFDRDGFYYKLNAEASYDDNAGETSPKIAATVSDIFSVGSGTDNLGVVGSISWFERDFGSDNVETGGGWDIDLEEGEAALQEMEQRDYSLTRERLGAALNIDYRLNANNELYMRSLYSEYTDQEIRLANIYELDENDDEEEFVAVARELKDREETQKIVSWVFGGITYNDDWTYKYSVGFSKAEENTPEHIDGAAFELDAEELFGFSGMTKPRPNANFNLNDASQYEFDEAEIAKQDTSDEERNIKIDLSKDMIFFGQPGTLKFGGKISRREKQSDETIFTVEVDDLTLDQVATADVDWDLGDFGPGISSSKLESALAAGELEKDKEESFANDYKINEDIDAAYVMSIFDVNDWSFIAGVRYEGTEFNAKGFKFITEDETAEAVSYSNDYDHWLPAFHARYRMSDATLLRAAWTNSVVRPNFEQIRPGEVDDEGEIEKGNPQLEALESANLDVGIEHYMGTASMVSVFLFYKDIENFIYETESDDVTTYENGKSADLYGVELAYSKQFSELPAPWNGMLLSANLTYTESEAEIEYDEITRDIRLPGQSDLTSNIMIGYETQSFGVRLAANYKSDYLDEVGDGDADENDIFADDHVQIDLTANYFITDSLQITFKGINLTDEPYYVFQKDEKYNAQYEEYGPTYKLGVVYSNF